MIAISAASVFIPTVIPTQFSRLSVAGSRFTLNAPTESAATMTSSGWSLQSARRLAVDSVLRTEELEGRRPRSSISTDGYRVLCYRGNLIDELREGEGPFRRTTFITVHHFGTLVSVASLVEWSFPYGFSPYEFWWAADFVSQGESDLAYIVASYWADHEWPGDFGSVVLFDRLAIRTDKDRGRAALSIIRVMLEREFGRRAALLMLKAFPLEYESEPFEREDRGKGLKERQAAMMRMYSRHLGVAPFVDQDAHGGWMWRPLRYCPPPISTVANLDWLPAIK